MAPDTTRFNLEIKYFPDHVGTWHPDAATFAALVLEAIQEANLEDRVTVQSFAPVALEAVHRLAPELATVLLVDQPGTLRNWLRALTFTPFAISPSFSMLTDRHIRAAHRRGMAVVPWTVNDELEFQRLVARGVDGIITDDPCRMLPYVPR
jgi:glycerophosphoryl diester phosphodiesterase